MSQGSEGSQDGFDSPVSQGSQGSPFSSVSSDSQGSQDVPFEPFGPPPSPPTASDAKRLYFVDTVEKTIQILYKFPNSKYKYTEPDHIKFFEELPKKAGGGIYTAGFTTKYYITELMRTLFDGHLKTVNAIFNELRSNKGGSRRRRPSRKYKKSKRVLRRKSRSTRRR
jgi:hypothetical protein